MSEQKFTCDAHKEVSSSKDSLLSCETMQSFLSILEGLGGNNSQGASNDDDNERIKKNSLSEHSFGRNAEMRQTTSFPEEGGARKNSLSEHSFGRNAEMRQTTSFPEEGGARKKDEILVIIKFDEFTNHSSTALHLNKMLFPTSMKRVSVPSAFYRPSRIGLDETYSKTTQILRASCPTSKMLTAKLIAASRLSKSATIMRSTGSMWMTKAQKSKAFPNYITPAIDTSIMKIEDDFDIIEEVKDPEFCKIIDAATPKVKASEHARNEYTGNTTSPDKKSSDANLTNNYQCCTNKLKSTTMDYHAELSDNPGQTVKPQRNLCHCKEVENDLESSSDECVFSGSGPERNALDQTKDASVASSTVSTSESSLCIRSNESSEGRSAATDDTADDSEDNNNEVGELATVHTNDEFVQFGGDSLFGILGVYCNSELHYGYG